MKYLLLSLFITTNAFASSGSGNVSNVVGYGATPGIAQSPMITVSDIRNKFTIMCGSGSVNGTINNYYRCIKLAAMTASQEQYEVTAGNTAYCSGFYFSSNVVSARFTLGYGSAALVAHNTATAPTGDKSFDGGTGFMELTGLDVVDKPIYMSMPIQFPAGSFPYMRMQTGSATMVVSMICEEIAD